VWDTGRGTCGNREWEKKIREERQKGNRRKNSGKQEKTNKSEKIKKLEKTVDICPGVWYYITRR
jgi:hypothetical protein